MALTLLPLRTADGGTHWLVRADEQLIGLFGIQQAGGVTMLQHIWLDGVLTGERLLVWQQWAAATMEALELPVVQLTVTAGEMQALLQQRASASPVASPVDVPEPAQATAAPKRRRRRRRAPGPSVAAFLRRNSR